MKKTISVGILLSSICLTIQAVNAMDRDDSSNGSKRPTQRTPQILDLHEDFLELMRESKPPAENSTSNSSGESNTSILNIASLTGKTTNYSNCEVIIFEPSALTTTPE